ncbi:MerR family transcriptional regulator [Clostridiaceae bacterium M8S5]|nr:MerR family transcriptional regulator [Clostridiaceae bacterium M8S5]
MFKQYKTGELLNYLDVTRDTLRFYEKKGLLNPKKNNENNYRSYDIFDVYRLMIIDFYKKRGLSIQQIQSVLEKTKEDELQKILIDKRKELEKSIFEQQSMLNRIIETQNFSSDLNNKLNTFTVKTMPLYRVNDEVSDFVAVEEYKNIIGIKSNSEDMFSKIMRYVSFDETRVIDSKILIVEPVKKMDEKGKYIHSKKCLYTVVEEISNDNQIDIMQEMHIKSKSFAREKGLNLTGEAFAIIRYITLEEHNIHAYIEIYIPFE